MKIRPLAIVSGEPNSISSEIIFKSWIKRKEYKHNPLIIIGSINLLNKQKKKLKFKVKLKKINNKFKASDLKGDEMPVYNINYNQVKPFEKISSKSNKYIVNCFNAAVKLVKADRILGIINCPISKENLFKNKYQGITEFLSKKFKKEGKEVMLIYNKDLAVCPITTHLPLKKVSNQLNKIKIVNKVKTINNFYKRFFNKKPNFGILGLNPHNFSPLKNSEEKRIITKAINDLKKLKINVFGPISPDSSFTLSNKNNFDVLIGMYHDQVLGPYKALYNFNAINITLGLPCVRISPDHGTGENIVGKKIADPKSLIESIKFFKNIN